MKKLTRLLSMFLLLTLLLTAAIPASAQSDEQGTSNPLIPYSSSWLGPYLYNDEIYVGVNGMNGTITGGMHTEVDLGEHNLKIELFYGTTASTITNSAGFVETTDITRYPEDISITVPVSNSYYWKAVVTGTKHGDQVVNCSSYSFFPYNKKGERCPDPLFMVGGQSLPFPQSTAWEVVDNPVTWTSQDEYEFRMRYNNVDWSKYKIHHVRPLKYGGTNDASNVFAISNQEYDSMQIWWENY